MFKVNNKDTLTINLWLIDFQWLLDLMGNRFGGGVIIYASEDIPSKQLAKHKLPDYIEGIFIEINLERLSE